MKPGFLTTCLPQRGLTGLGRVDRGAVADIRYAGGARADEDARQRGCTYGDGHFC